MKPASCETMFSLGHILPDTRSPEDKKRNHEIAMEAMAALKEADRKYSEMLKTE
ncbi:hypothetical protein O0S10_09030 [Methanocorpusculum sp. MG]|uniref:Uncharacterized protein n=1 Tax=Methanocorpusculum petauri TaxID=3002863 RepID=A0ABT4III8_9EURY|nr:hypothetical protein [Methanocorpusculum petauri]MCZ0861361.1 hypothetical protein [Methanocorpusculum petauri]MDE2443708.1 hypothetical protein [Methanocorpusculum sp.]